MKDRRFEIDKKMHRMKLDYYDSHTNGEVLSVITNDVEAVNTLLGKNTYSVITQSILMIGVLIMLITINAWLALIAVLMIPATILLSGHVRKKSGRFFFNQQNLLGKVNGYVEETYNGQAVVTSFNYQGRAKERFDELNEALRGTAREAERYAGVVMPLTQMVIYIGYGVSAIIGCVFALKGYMTVGNVQSALQYINFFQQPFTTIAQMSGQLSSALASGERIFAFLDAEEEVPDPVKGKVPEVCDGSVEFKHVQFGYTPDHLLMKDVSVQVEPGMKFAIVGPTGAGKTTLVNLLMRFYEINGGEIWVDGVNTKEMTRHELRTHFGMVLQDTWLFEGTIRDNLLYAKPDATEAELLDACGRANILEFVEKQEKGLDTLVGNRGLKLSGGEKQRISIARVLLKDPTILIFDEATSALDSISEKKIQEAIDPLVEERTSILIAHRLSTILAADEILVVKDGEIVERGTHEKLVDAGGVYTELYETQFKKGIVKTGEK